MEALRYNRGQGQSDGVLADLGYRDKNLVVSSRSVFCRCHPLIFLENPGEVALGGKPETVADGNQAYIGIAEQACGLLAFFEDEVGQGDVGFQAELAGEVRAGKAERLRHRFRIDGFAQMLLYTSILA